MSTAPNSDIHDHVRLTKFFLVVSIFLIVISILAIYTTVAATEYGAKKDDMQTASLTHLLKSMDWLNDYEAQKIAEIVLQAQIDNLNITLQHVNNNHTNNSNNTHTSSYNPLAKYKSYINMLYAD